MVQARDRGDEVEAASGRVRHYIAPDESEAVGGSGRMKIDPDYFFASSGEAAREEALTAADVERAIAMGRDGAQDPVVIGDVVVPGLPGQALFSRFAPGLR